MCGTWYVLCVVVFVVGAFVLGVVFIYFFVADFFSGWDWFRWRLLHLSFRRRPLLRWCCLFLFVSLVEFFGVGVGLGCMVVYIFVVRRSFLCGVITCGAYRGVVFWRLCSGSPEGFSVGER